VLAEHSRFLKLLLYHTPLNIHPLSFRTEDKTIVTFRRSTSGEAEADMEVDNQEMHAVQTQLQTMDEPAMKRRAACDECSRSTLPLYNVGCLIVYPHRDEEAQMHRRTTEMLEMRSRRHNMHVLRSETDGSTKEAAADRG